MATDPVRAIQRRDIGHPYDLALDGSIARLAALEPDSAIPYLTVTIDWRPEGIRTLRSQGYDDPKRSQRRVAEPDISGLDRPARTELQKAATELLATWDERSAARISLEADFARLFTFLDQELEPGAQGAIVVANQSRGVWETLMLAIPVATSVTTGAMPGLRTLVRVAEDYEPYGVLLADQIQATLTFFVQDQPFDELTVRSSSYPRKQSTGGLNQRRYQNRADERVAAFARVVAAETQKTLDELGIESFFVAGDEVITSALDTEWHPAVRRRIGGVLRLPIEATVHEQLAVVAPLEVERERQEELDAVAAVETALASGDLARAGDVAVIAALNGHQVEALVMNADYSAPGWVDYRLDLAGAGAIPAEHPAGGTITDLVAVDLGEEMIRRALIGKARIEIVDPAPRSGDMQERSDAARRLDVLGGVAATLRFSVLPDDRTGA